MTTIARSTSPVPPAHFILKIETFSSLQENAVEKYESLKFDAGGHKWQLVVYPNGNRNKDVKDHISLYLAIVETSSLGFGWEVYAVFRLFLLDQNEDNFLILQDATGRERRFHGLKGVWGFDEFIPLKAFKDASNGYLVGDTCVFGAEVFVKERNKGIGECLSMKKLQSASSFSHVWKIENFSKLWESFYESEVFEAGDQKWKIKLYPKGDKSAIGSHLSLYLVPADLSVITRGFKIYARFTMRIRDQLGAKHKELNAEKWLCDSIGSWGWPSFIELSELNKAGNGYAVNDVCFVEADVAVLGVSGELSVPAS